MRRRSIKAFAVVGALVSLVAAVQWMPTMAGAPRTGTARHGSAVSGGHDSQRLARRLAGPADLRSASFYSGALGGVAHIHILLPDDYTSTTRRYPVLYLLAGHQGSYSQWGTNSDVIFFARRLPLIVVMPDGGEGWYANPLVANKPRWEDYPIGDLIPYMDSHYRTLAARTGRALAGPSMGGLGAFNLAARHPDMFVVAGSFSGFVDLIALQEPLLLRDYPTTVDVFGNPRTDSWNWQGHDPVELAPNLRGIRLYLASGNGHPTPPYHTDFREVYSYSALKNMATALARNSIPVTVDYYGPGVHSWMYYTRDLHRAMPLILEAFAHPPAPPLPWNYHTTDTRFAVWGYQGTRTGGAPGWTYLDNVSAVGFRAAGTGLLTLRTAPLYHPGASYVITVDGVRQASVVRADAAGRLSLQVTLNGPGAPRTFVIGR